MGAGNTTRREPRPTVGFDAWLGVTVVLLGRRGDSGRGDGRYRYEAPGRVDAATATTAATAARAAGVPSAPTEEERRVDAECAARYGWVVAS